MKTVLFAAGVVAGWALKWLVDDIDRAVDWSMQQEQHINWSRGGYILDVHGKVRDWNGDEVA